MSIEPNSTQDTDVRQAIPTQGVPASGEPHKPHRGLRIGGAIGAGTLAIAALLVLVSSVLGSTPAAPATAARASVVNVAVTSPTSNSVIAADAVTVRGTVTPDDADVQVQGHPAAVSDGVFVGTASLHGGKTTIDVIGSAPDAAPGSTSVVVDRQSESGSHAGSHAGSGSSPAPAAVPAPSYSVPSGSYGQASCGGELTVGPDTSCAFAENVRSAYESSGAGTVSAYSPVTGETYEMTCSSGAYVECSGADNASVYFPAASAGDSYYAPEQDYEAQTATAPAGQTSCGDGLSVGPDTTCVFAENVRSAYESSGPGTVMAYSPVTNRTYAMRCTAGETVVCTGGNNATVYFS